MVLYSELLRHICSGKRVLYACMTTQRGLDIMREIMEGAGGMRHELTFNRVGRRIDHPSGGYVYFASQDHQVIGLEFDRVVGAPTERMLMRVRSKDTNNG